MSSMRERIDRQADEDLYQPKIHSHRIRELCALKLITGLPMTVLVDQAIRDFLEKAKESRLELLLPSSIQEPKYQDHSQ